jgi:hypothetical protein
MYHLPTRLDTLVTLGRYVLVDARVHRLWLWYLLEDALGTGRTAPDARRTAGTFTAHFLRKPVKGEVCAVWQWAYLAPARGTSPSDSQNLFPGGWRGHRPLRGWRADITVRSELSSKRSVDSGSGCERAWIDLDGKMRFGTIMERWQ